MLHPALVLWLQSNWLDGVASWAKLVALGVSVLVAIVGYKVNQALFKTGGVMEKLAELDKKHVKLEEQGDDHERRIGDLEKDRRWRR